MRSSLGLYFHREKIEAGRVATRPAGDQNPSCTAKTIGIVGRDVFS
jgi:hypothetical protein